MLATPLTPPSAKKEPQTTFTPGLWIDTMDSITVKSDGALVFKFLSGTEVTV